MDITFFGWIWIFLMFICIFLPFRYTFRLLIISTIFQSSSVLNIFDNGIYPMLITELYIILKFLLIKNEKKDLMNYESKKMIKELFIFLIVTSIITFISFYLFRNKIFFDSYTKTFFGLKFSFSSIIRIITLFCNITTMYILYRTKNLLTNDFIMKSMLLSLSICLFIGFWEFICKKTGYLNLFPYSFIYNNISYTQGYNQSIFSGNVRMNSTFLEPSYFGCFLVANFFSIFAINNGKKYNLYLLFILICLVLNLSGTGIVSFLLVGIYYLFIYKKFKIRKKTLIFSILFSIFAIAILYISGYFNRILDMLVSKMSSISGNRRTSADSIAISIFLNTYLIGGGWSSYRGSSLIFSSLGQVGIIGVACFIKPLYCFLKKIRRENYNNYYYNFGFIYIIAVIISMALSIPDITFMILWLPLYYLVSINEKEELK